MVTGYLITAIGLLFKIITGAILVEVILSWVMVGKKNSFTELIKVFTAPFLTPGRMLQEKLMPGMMIDFSPILGLVLADLLENIIIRIILMF